MSTEVTHDCKMVQISPIILYHGTHSYDIVEGPMADDEVWDYVEDFLSGRITREAFWALARFKHPTHQIIFCTDKALQTIKFELSYEL